MPARFYCPDPPSDGVYRLKAGEAKHLSRVCRLGVGDEVEIFDGRGGATRAKVIALGNDWVDLVAVGEPIPDACPPSLSFWPPPYPRPIGSTGWWKKRPSWVLSD